MQVNGRDKLAIKNVISEYIPNPTFSVVARPAPRRSTSRTATPRARAVGRSSASRSRSPDAFFRPEPRLALMDEQGIDRAIMWPTLASVLEERLTNDPEATHAVMHAFNQWMYEEWTFNYEDRIFADPGRSPSPSWTRPSGSSTGSPSGAPRSS